jgi:predicted DNA-binding WGR domain protein
MVTIEETIEQDTANEIPKGKYDYFYFENKANGHDKFWAVEIKEEKNSSDMPIKYSLIRRWGKIGTNGQVMIEDFNSLWQADTRKRGLIDEKIAKGYEPVI